MVKPITKKPIKRPRHPTKGKFKRPGPVNMIGSDAKMPELIERAWRLKHAGHTHAQVCVKLAKEFEMPRVPSHQTLYEWMRRGRDRLKDREGVISEYVDTGLRQLMHINEDFTVIALKKGVKCMKAKVGAAAVVQKGIEAGRRLLGIGTGDKGTDETTSEQFSLTLIKNFAQVIVMPGTGPKDRPSLALTSGDKDIDALECDFVVQKK